MIKFNAENKKLNDYMEMAVKFGASGEPFERFEDFYNALSQQGGKDTAIISSSGVDYNNQEEKWKTFADKYGYDGKKELANAIAKMINESFPGIEGLAALSGNKTLFEYSDYNMNTNADHLIMSLFYGGNRLRQWKQYAKPFITPNNFIEQLINAHDFDAIEFLPRIQRESQNVVKIIFEDDFDSTDDTQKKRMLKLLENADGLLDFKIAENFEAPTWTITIK